MLAKSVIREMPNKVNKEVAKNVEKQKSMSKAVSEKDQGCYVDSSRNIAVCLDSKELFKSLKKFPQDVSKRGI